MATILHLTSTNEKVQVSASSPAERLQNSINASINNNKAHDNSNNMDSAVKVDTKALFVRTPDGTMHVKTGTGYSPDISAASYVRK